MIEANGGGRKELPAQQKTIDTIASEVKNLMGKDGIKTFQIGEAESGKTLQVLNYPVAPWRSTRRDGLRIGKEVHMNLQQEEDVLNGMDMDTSIQITQYRLDTSWKKQPILRIGITDQYLESEKSAFAERLYAKKQAPESEQWTPSTEDQAQTLQTIVKSLTKDKALEHTLSSRTIEQKSNDKAKRTQLEQDCKRIFDASKDFVADIENTEQVMLSLDNKTVSITQRKEKNALQVSIAESEIVQGTTTTVSENYISISGMPIDHYTHFLRNPAESGSATPTKNADQEKTNYLFTVLEMLTDEKIQTELTGRKNIQTKIEGLLTQKGELKAEHIVAPFQRKNFKAYISKTLATENAHLVVEIENTDDKNHIENENDIELQSFSLHMDRPLQVTTYMYGEEEGRKALATAAQTEYLIALLDELSTTS